jgi:hypothetical protein
LPSWKNWYSRSTPLGTQRPDIEEALTETFRTEWEMYDVAVEYVSNRGFRVPISEGDYSLRSEIAREAELLPTKAYAVFLVGSDDALKDVQVEHRTL